MIRGFCQAHDEDPTLFRFLLFVQHGQLSKLAPGTPTPVDAVRTVLERGIASKEIPDQPPDVATALVFGIVLQPVTFAAYGRLPIPHGFDERPSRHRGLGRREICLGDLSCDRLSSSS